jgi:hypothetical protein
MINSIQLIFSRSNNQYFPIDYWEFDSTKLLKKKELLGRE